MAIKPVWSDADGGFVHTFDSVDDFLRVITNYFILKSDNDFKSDNVSTLTPRINVKLDDVKNIDDLEYSVIERCDERFLTVPPDDEDIKLYIETHQECLSDVHKLIRKAEAILGLEEKSLEDKLCFRVDYSTDEYLPIFKPFIVDSLGSEYNKQYVNEESKVDLYYFRMKMAGLKTVACIDERVYELLKEYVTNIMMIVTERVEQAPEYFLDRMDSCYKNNDSNGNESIKDARHDYYVRKQNKSKNIKSIYW